MRPAIADAPNGGRSVTCSTHLTAQVEWVGHGEGLWLWLGRDGRALKCGRELLGFADALRLLLLLQLRQLGL